jgi:hypothetical protein
VTTQDSRTESRGGPDQVQDPHRSLHSETGARPGEHPGRSRNPLVKVAGLAWLEFEKPDLDRAGRFGADFGFTVANRTPDTLLLRGRWASAACLVIRRGPQPRFAGVAFQAASRDDLDRLARGTGGTVMAYCGGHAVRLRDPSGYPVHVVHGIPELPALPERPPLPLNFGAEPVRANATQRPARRPAEIQRLGHVARSESPRVAYRVRVTVVVEVDEHIVTGQVPFPDPVSPPPQVGVRVGTGVQMVMIRAVHPQVDKISGDAQRVRQARPAHHAIRGPVLLQQREDLLALLADKHAAPTPLRRAPWGTPACRPQLA